MIAIITNNDQIDYYHAFGFDTEDLDVVNQCMEYFGFTRDQYVLKPLNEIEYEDDGIDFFYHYPIEREDGEESLPLLIKPVQVECEVAVDNGGVYIKGAKLILPINFEEQQISFLNKLREAHLIA
jgi:hypothetical protein